MRALPSWISAEAQAFAKQWSRTGTHTTSMPLLLALTDDVVFTSPLARSASSADERRVPPYGKEALRPKYWSEGVRLIPDLHFEVLRPLRRGQHPGHQLPQPGRQGWSTRSSPSMGSLVKEGHGAYLSETPACPRVSGPRRRAAFPFCCPSRFPPDRHWLRIPRSR